MSGRATARRVEAAINRRGETCTLSRGGEGTTISLKGKPKVVGDDDVGENTARQRLLEIRIGTAKLAASAWTDKVPKRADKIKIEVEGRTYAVQLVDTKRDSGVVVEHVLHVAG